MDVPHEEQLTPTQRSLLRSVGRAIEAARRQIRGGKTDPALLRRLGMTEERFSGFVEEYDRLLGELKDILYSADPPSGTVEGKFALPGSVDFQRGRGVDRALSDVSGAEKLSPDAMRKLYESRAAKVAPEYRKQVEGYFRAISEGERRASPATAPAE